jgi:hypothetical protein
VIFFPVIGISSRSKKFLPNHELQLGSADTQSLRRLLPFDLLLVQGNSAEEDRGEFDLPDLVCGEGRGNRLLRLQEQARVEEG